MKTVFLLKFLALPFLVLFGQTPNSTISANISFWCVKSQPDQRDIKRAMEMKNKDGDTDCQ